SHKVELPTIYMMEFNDDVLEYYDQPPKIKMNYFQSKKDKNRKMAYWYTADFFVIEKNRAYWVECKTEEHLIRSLRKNQIDILEIMEDGNSHSEKIMQYSLVWIFLYVRHLRLIGYFNVTLNFWKIILPMGIYPKNKLLQRLRRQ